MCIVLLDLHCVGMGVRLPRTGTTLPSKVSHINRAAGRQTRDRKRMVSIHRTCIEIGTTCLGTDIHPMLKILVGMRPRERHGRGRQKAIGGRRQHRWRETAWRAA